MTKLQISLALLLSTLAAPAVAQDADWRRVPTLDSGQEITLTTRGGSGATRYFVSADDDAITVLNLADPAMPDAAARALREAASKHPEYLDAARSGHGFVWNNVRVAPSGVFVGNQKVAELQQVIESRARTDVAEITRMRRGRGFWGHLGFLGGYFVGGMAPVAVASLVCKAASCAGRDLEGVYIAMAVGAISGGAYGAYAAHHETEETVYQAP